MQMPLQEINAEKMHALFASKSLLSIILGVSMLCFSDKTSERICKMNGVKVFRPCSRTPFLCLFMGMY